MRIIYKYPLIFTPEQQHTSIRVPTTSKVVGVGIDANTQICVWIDRPVIDGVEKIEQFYIVGTGIEFEPDCWHSVGIVISLPFVWHVLQFKRE